MPVDMVVDHMNDLRGPLESAYKRMKGGEYLLPYWWLDDDGLCACDAGQESRQPGEHVIEDLAGHHASIGTRRRIIVAHWIRSSPKCRLVTLKTTSPKEAPISPESATEISIPEDANNSLPSSCSVDLARLFIRQMATCRDHIRIVDQDLYIYVEDMGIWSRLDDHEIKSAIQKNFHGKMFTIDGKRIRLTVAPTKRDHVHDALMHETSIRRRGMFLDAPSGLTLKNGWIGYGDWELRPYAPSQLSRHQMPCDYDPDADYSPFSEFLDQLFANDEDKSSKISLLQEFIGACMFGKAAQFQRSLLLYGPAAKNGKSTLMSILCDCLFPPGAVQSVSPGHWVNDRYVRLLDGALVNNAGELRPRSISRADSVFKTIVSGDEIVARKLYSDPYVIKPIAGHVFMANKLPYVSDLTNGFWRRVIILTFNNVFNSNKLPQSFVEKMRTYREGMAIWAIEGARRLLVNGDYTLPLSHHVVMEEWRDQFRSTRMSSSNHRDHWQEH